MRGANPTVAIPINVEMWTLCLGCPRATQMRAERGTLLAYGLGLVKRGYHLRETHVKQKRSALWPGFTKLRARINVDKLSVVWVAWLRPLITSDMGLARLHPARAWTMLHGPVLAILPSTETGGGGP